MIWALLALACLSVFACFACYRKGYQAGVMDQVNIAFIAAQKQMEAAKRAADALPIDPASVQNDPDNRDTKPTLFDRQTH